MMRRSHSLAGLAVLAAVAAVGVTAPATAATSRTLYANPDGGGTICNKTDPCLLGDAMNQAASGDTIIIEPGSYGSAHHQLASQLELSSPNVTIEDAPGGAEPVIYSDAVVGITLSAGSSLDRLDLHYSAGTAGLELGGGTASHVTVRATSGAVACAVDGGSLTDSLCVAQAPTGTAVQASATTGSVTATLRGVTAEAPGASGIGIHAQANRNLPQPAGTVSIAATNVIAHGGAEDVAAVAADDTSTSATITMTNSDYVTSEATSSPGTASVHAGAGDVTAPPVFVDAAHGNYREKSSSPTVNAGATDPKGDTDLAGHPRTVGSAPDIGAYERLEAPVIGKTTLTKVTRHAAKLTVRVKTEGLATSLKFVATAGKAHVKGKLPAVAATATKPVKITVKGLKRHTKYSVVVKAHSAGGSATSRKVTVTTH